MIRIVAEKSIPYLQGCLEPFAQVEYLDNPSITREYIQSADALIVRSITKCRAELLEGTNVRFIATATAGIDHIDNEYCRRAGISWERSTGCNAMAVAQYVFSALSLLSLTKGYSLMGKTIGIIGVGQVGRQVERIALAWGMRVLRYDPPRAESEGWTGFSTLEELQAESDIISLHVPLTEETKHLVNDTFLSQCHQCEVLINACRGAVTDSEALIRAKRSGQLAYLIVDCWEHEPHIRQDLLPWVDLATPHIAGFSADGKHRGSRMAVLAVARYFGFDIGEEVLAPLELLAPSDVIDLSTYPQEEQLARAMLATLNLSEVDALLRSGKYAFEYQRKHYHYPREMSAHRIIGASPALSSALKDIGFILM